MAYHTVTTRISDSDISQGKDIAASFKKISYASVYRYNADKETILADADSSKQSFETMIHMIMLFILKK